jgi:hypothetical protein
MITEYLKTHSMIKEISHLSGIESQLYTGTITSYKAALSLLDKYYKK